MPRRLSNIHAIGTHPGPDAAGANGYRIHTLPPAAARSAARLPAIASPATIIVHAPENAVATMITYRCSAIAITAPATDAMMTATDGGSERFTYTHMTCTRIAPMPAPMR